MYQRILVPLDGSQTAARGLREAIDLAFALDARLLLLHVIESFPSLEERSGVASYDDMLGELREYGEALLIKAAQATAEEAVPADAFLREARDMQVFETIVNEARALACDLIVMGTHGRRGLSRLTMGSDAEMVVRTSPVPVLLVRNTEEQIKAEP